MASRVGEKIKLTSIDELLCVPETNGTIEIELGLISAFENHPFRVVDDEKMEELVESIRQQGILSPVLVRPDDEGGYEMISGHRRLHAATIVGLKKIPAIVKELTDDEAIIAMVNANLQREEILPSERGFSLKMKMDAMRHQGSCRHDVAKLSVVERKTATIVGEGSGLTGRSVQRYIRLTELIPELLDMVDTKRLSLVNGVDISYFDKDVQKWLYEYIKDNGNLKPEQIAALKEQRNLENMTQYTVIAILNDALPKKSAVKKVSFSEKKLSKYFPADYPASKCERIITELLEKWKLEQEAQDGI
ncbi:ParB/RepB/Spo0J family partition protein [Kineothrix sedimenti]|uniref:ParB/RepB/Spo0J family partition protein n=1 Tax=Kineothrix sedimenti TaxID=3123317 RepID=A0ABZ3EZ41_9FIRM